MANKINLYRSEDIQIVTEKMKEIVTFADIHAKKILEPTIYEYRTVFKTISDYIKKNNQIVYGSLALNEMLKDKSPKDTIYDEYTKNDIEIYSVDPIFDVISMCDLLHQNKYKYIEGKEADHPGTFTIFVNFEKYCDITYVPRIIYHNLPTIKVNGYRLINPVFMLVDRLRVYSDPLTSYFVLEKTFTRTNLLLKVATFNPTKGEIKENTKYTHILNKLVPKISNIQNIIFVDDPAYNYYMQQSNNKNQSESHIGIIVPNIEKNGQLIYNTFLDIIAEIDTSFRENIKVEEYNIFFQFWNRRIIIFYKNQPIVTIYQNKYKCYQYNEIERYNTKINIGNFTLILLNYLIHYNHNMVFKLENKEYEYRIGNLLDAKNTYLSKNKLTVLDKSPFREFQAECMGDSIEFRRSVRLKINKRKEKGGPLVYRYQPESNNNTLASDKYIFPNESGSLITNEQLKFIKL